MIRLGTRLGVLVFFSIMFVAIPADAAVVTNPMNVAGQTGVYEFTRTFSVDAVDFNDNWSGSYPDDFFFVRHDPQLGLGNLPTSTLRRNLLGAGFTDGGTGMFGKTDKHGCAWGDYNNDGRQDMACAIGFGQFSKNELWRQNPDGTFTNVARALGIQSNTHGRYRYVTFIDANNDGNQDLYFARYYGMSVGSDPAQSVLLSRRRMAQRAASEPRSGSRIRVSQCSRVRTECSGWSAQGRQRVRPGHRPRWRR